MRETPFAKTPSSWFLIEGGAAATLASVALSCAIMLAAEAATCLDKSQGFQSVESEMASTENLLLGGAEKAHTSLAHEALSAPPVGCPGKNNVPWAPRIARASLTLGHPARRLRHRFSGPRKLFLCAFSALELNLQSGGGVMEGGGTILRTSQHFLDHYEKKRS